MEKICLDWPGTALLMVLITALSACNGDGGDDAGAPASGEQTPTATTLKVVPSLGRFASGTPVVLQKPDGSSVGEALIGDDGTASVELNGYDGPLLIKVAGGAGVQYFDEVAGQLADFPAGQVMRALLPAVQGGDIVAVTPLTDVAAALAGNTSDSDVIRAANARLAAVFGLADILLPPQLIGADTRELSSADNGTDYALALYALLAGSSPGAEPHRVMADLANDLSDGTFDGAGSDEVTVKAYNAAVLQQHYQALREQGATRYGDENTRNNVALIPASITPSPTAVPAAVASDLAGGKLWMREVRIAGLSLEQEFSIKGIRMQRNMAQLGSGTAADMESIEALLRTMDALRQMQQGVSPKFIANAPANTFFVSDFICGATLQTPGNVSSVSDVACRYGAGGKRYGVRVMPNANGGYSWDSFTFTSNSAQAVPFGSGVDGSIDVTGSLGNGNRIDDIQVSLNGVLPLYNADPSGVRTLALQGHWVSDGVVSELRSIAGSVSKSKQLAGGQLVQEKLTINSGSFASVDNSSGNMRLNLSLKAETQTGFSYIGQLVLDNNQAIGSAGRQIPTRFSLQGEAFDGSERFAGLNARLDISNPEVLVTAANGELAQASIRQLAGSFALSLDVLRSDGRPARLTLAATARDGTNGDATLTFTHSNPANVDKTVTIGFSMLAGELQMPVKAVGDGYEIHFDRAGSSWSGVLLKGSTTLAQINASRINYVDGSSESLM